MVLSFRAILPKRRFEMREALASCRHPLTAQGLTPERLTAPPPSRS
jgi:hypothetical protein